MKIALIGTHSTGKTTLCQHLLLRLLEENFDAHLLPEFSRLCPYPINENTTIEAQRWILDQQIMREGLYHASTGDRSKQGRIIICDRASIDNLAYLQRVAELTDTDAQKEERRAIQHANTYDHIFKTQKLDLDAKEDGIRSTDKAFRDEMDARIDALLEKHHINYTLLDPTTAYTVHVNRMMNTLFPDN